MIDNDTQGIAILDIDLWESPSLFELLTGRRRLSLRALSLLEAVSSSRFFLLVVVTRRGMPDRLKSLVSEKCPSASFSQTDGTTLGIMATVRRLRCVLVDPDDAYHHILDRLSEIGEIEVSQG